MKFDIAARDKIIYKRYRESKYRFGNIAAFKDMTARTLGQLILYEYIEDTPLVRSVYEFMKQYPDYTCHGYTTQDSVVIEGVEKGMSASSPEEFKTYMSTFGNFERFNESTMYCKFRKDV